MFSSSAARARARDEAVARRMSFIMVVRLE
jgi:hypothetical protein